MPHLNPCPWPSHPQAAQCEAQVPHPAQVLRAHIQVGQQAIGQAKGQVQPAPGRLQHAGHIQGTGHTLHGGIGGRQGVVQAAAVGQAIAAATRDVGHRDGRSSLPVWAAEQALEGGVGGMGLQPRKGRCVWEWNTWSVVH